jgi:hypothetical protein
MFERDVQGILDAYLQRKISEDSFLEQSFRYATIH